MRRREVLAALAAGMGAAIRPAGKESPPASLRTKPPAKPEKTNAGVKAMVLGTAQDGGIPQIGCRCPNCEKARRDPGRGRLIASLALADLDERKLFIVDASPDIRIQADRALGLFLPPAPSLADALAGVLLTHAHIGHYTGLMFFGYESMAARRLQVFGSKRMVEFLAANGPWSQVVRQENISPRTFKPGQEIRLTAKLKAVPFEVPHRDEYADTFGFEIAGPERTLLYIPDIRSWEAWERPLGEALRSADMALLDGTFFGPGELPGRDMAEIGHPLIVDTLRRIDRLPAAMRAKVRFIHLNHTNPALDPDGAARRTVEQTGARIAEEGEIFEL